MRKTVVALVTISMLLLVTAPALAKGKPVNGCPASASGWVLVDGEGWWAATVEGFAQEGLTAEEAAAEFGFTDVEEFKEWVIVGAFTGIDKDGNGLVCMQDLPNTPGLPGYLINIVDDNSSAIR